MKIRIGGRTLHFKGFQWKKMKWTIRKQMLLWLSAIFIVMFVAMNVFIVRNVQAGNEEYINDDLVVLKNNGLLYVKQILVMNNLDNNEEGFEKIAAALCEEIAGATGNPTAAYAMDGRLIEATNPVLFAQSDFDDLRYAKGGISALTHALAVSLAGRVRVNAIAPGWIDTSFREYHGPDASQQPAGRVGNPRDIANLALFLASDKAGFITGENICVDGGMTKLMIYHNAVSYTHLTLPTIA